MTMITREFLEKKATESLAVACVHLLSGNAGLEFPTTSKSGPSRMVLIVLTPKGELWRGARAYFPLMVHTKVWHSAAVPVLEEYRGATQFEREWVDFKGRIQRALIEAFREAGFVPPAESTSLDGSVLQGDSAESADLVDGEASTGTVDFDPVREEFTFRRLDE